MNSLHEIDDEKFLNRLYCENHHACFDINLPWHQEIYKRIGSYINDKSKFIFDELEFFECTTGLLETGAAIGLLMKDIERERDFYRQQCNELHARLLQLLQEQARLRKEARRSAVVARLIYEAYPLASLEIPADEIARKFLQIVLNTVHLDIAMVLEYLRQTQTITVREVLGGPTERKFLHLPADSLKEFHFTSARSTSDPLTKSLVTSEKGDLWGNLYIEHRIHCIGVCLD